VEWVVEGRVVEDWGLGIHVVGDHLLVVNNDGKDRPRR
jgi:hypothetical protein